MHYKTFICKGVQSWKNYLHLLANWLNYKTFIYRCCNPSLRLATKAKVWRLRAKREARSHTTYSRKCEKVWGNELSHPKGVPLWELESRWTPESSKGDYRGQNSMAWGVLYINGKLLKLKYLKWARIARLDIWNTSFGQKKGRESTRFPCV